MQHLESLNDVVEQITAVKQRETIPDEVVRRADELQLVDLTPLALRNRLARGDVYPPERIDTALANYFRPGNLAALRELALAWLADRVDEGLAEYRKRHGIEQPWETRERVLVALTGSADGERLVRRAARIAQRSKGELVAIHVVPQDGLSAPAAELLAQQHQLVEELGGSYHEVAGADVGEALLDAARSLNATQIVMGATRRSRWQRLTRGSVIGRVIRESGAAIDIHVISHPEARSEDAYVVPRTRRPTALPRRRERSACCSAPPGCPCLTLLLTRLREPLELPSVMLLFLLLIVIVAAVGGLGPGLASAISGFLLVNWFFIEPHHTLTIREAEDVLALFVFLTVGAIVSSFVALAARRAAEGARARAEAEALSRLAGSSPASAVLDGLRGVLGLEGAAILHRQEGGWRIEAASGDRVPESPDASTSTIELDSEHVLAPDWRPDPQRGSTRARRLRPRTCSLRSPRRARGGSRHSGNARGHQRTSRRAPLRCLPRPAHSPLGDQSLRHEPSSARCRVDTRGPPGVPRDDQRGDGPPECSRRQPARHEPAPSRSARDQHGPRRPRRGPARPRSTASAFPRAPSSSTCPKRCRASSPTAACSNEPSQT